MQGLARVHLAAAHSSRASSPLPPLSSRVTRSPSCSLSVLSTYGGAGSQKGMLVPVLAEVFAEAGVQPGTLQAALCRAELARPTFSTAWRWWAQDQWQQFAFLKPSRHRLHVLGCWAMVRQLLPQLEGSLLLHLPAECTRPSVQWTPRWPGGMSPPLLVPK